MASNDRQAEETRIRRILVINSFDLHTLEDYLTENGYLPDSSDEQAARDAVYKLRKDFTVDTSLPSSLCNIFLFRPSVEAFDLASDDAIVKEAESVRYDAVKDFIHMLAVRKAQTSATQQQQGSRDWDAAFEEKDA